MVESQTRVPGEANESPYLLERLGRVGGLIDRRGVARRVKQPNADGHCQRHRDDHPKEQSDDI